MNRIFILSLLAIMLLQTFSKALIVVDFQANKEYIMEFLCINRDKPELQCEGKCQLTKKLKEQEQSDNPAKERNQVHEMQINLFCQAWFSIRFSGSELLNISPSLFDQGHTTRAYFAIFHPPQSIA